MLEPYVGTSLLKEAVFERKKINGSLAVDANGTSIHERIPPYIPSQDIIRAVELTRILQRPLLIKGEPGCGKTRLAQAFAYEMYGDKYANYYFEWHIKSTTKAQEGLFQFDHVRRLRDVYEQNVPGKKRDDDADLQQSEEEQKEKELIKKRQYRSFGPLGKAFQASTEEHPAIVLIDEVDKADIDFPNDLLLELDQLRFRIEETEEEIAAEYPPIIFITSNEEKPLPPAFLRRCLFLYIEFPNPSVLKKIIYANFPLLDQRVINQGVKRFASLREQMDDEVHTDKKVSTSELIDWVKVINFHFVHDLSDRLMKQLSEEGISEEEQQFVTQLNEVLNNELSLEKFEELQQDYLMKRLSEDLSTLPELEEETSSQSLIQKVIAILGEEDSKLLVAQLEEKLLLHHQVLIKSLDDYKLYVAEARAERETTIETTIEAT